jgi:hypothetical protein
MLRTSRGFRRTSHGMQVRHDGIDLVVIQHVAEGGHHRPSHLDSVFHPRIIRRSSAREFAAGKNAYQRWSLAAFVMAGSAVLVIELRSVDRTGTGSRFGSRWSRRRRWGLLFSASNFCGTVPAGVGASIVAGGENESECQYDEQISHVNLDRAQTFRCPEQTRILNAWLLS